MVGTRSRAIRRRTLKLVGTRSCAIRHRTSEKGDHLVKLMGKSLSSDRARARFAEAKRSVETCSAGRAGAHPYRRRRSGSVLSFYGAYQEVHTEVTKVTEEILRLSAPDLLPISPYLLKSLRPLAFG